MLIFAELFIGFQCFIVLIIQRHEKKQGGFWFGSRQFVGQHILFVFDIYKMGHIYSEIIQEEDTLVLYILEEHEKGEEIKDRIPFTKDELIDAFEQYGGSFVQALGKCLQCADPINTGKIFDTWKNYVEQYVISYLKK